MHSDVSPRMVRPIIPFRMMNAIRRLRKEKGWSQEELAHRAGLRGGPSISVFEAGKGNPTLGTLKAIAAALGTDVTVLIADSPAVSEAMERAQRLTELFKALPTEYQDRLLEEAEILRRAVRQPELGDDPDRPG